MEHILAGIEPVEIWDHFYKLSQIPRPSGGEQEVCRYLYDLAKSLGLEASMDCSEGNDFGNVLVRCPATPGYEEAMVTVFQSHVDMVFLPHESKGLPLDLFLDGTLLRARGTTLGADNGIAVAMALSLMTGSDIVHGPLELLFTINEEAGMTGAITLPEGVLHGQFLINVDSQREDTITVCSAGANRSIFHLPLVMEPLPDSLVPLRIRIAGGKGGHSGLEINSGRANVGRILARILYETSKTVHLRLNDVTWGSVDNAIPAQASAIIVVRSEDVRGLKEGLDKWETTVKEEFGPEEGDLRILADEVAPLPDCAATTMATRNALAFLLALPHGVHTMSREMEGLVETSSNLAKVRTSQTGLTVTVSQRSLVDPSLDGIITQCEAVGILAGAEHSPVGKTYGWKPDMNSQLLSVCRNAYQRTFGEQPRVIGMHGMLECGLIKTKYPRMEMISIGPTIWDAHVPTKADYVLGADSGSPGERIDTARMPHFWEFVKAILKQLAQLKT